MVNQTSLQSERSFSNFTLSAVKPNYYLQPATTFPEQNSTVADDRFSSSQSEEKKPEKKSHKKRNFTLALGSSALLVGGGVLMLTRGLPKNTEKYLESLKKFLEKKLEKSKWKGADSWSEFWIYSIRKVDSFIDKAQSINNFTSIKDILFKNLMDRTKFTANIHKKITDFFERLARKTVLSSYKSTTQKFNKMYEAFDRLDERILANMPDEIIQYKGKAYKKCELLEIARQHRENVKNAVSDFTSEQSLRNRYKYIKKATSALYSQFWEQSMKGFWSKENKFLKKEMWQTYIADVKIHGNKKTMAEDVAQIRNKISYTDKDKTSVISDYLKTLKNLVAPSDKEGMDLIKKLEWFMENPQGLYADSDSFLNTLASLKDRPFEKGLQEAVIHNQMKLREANINSIKQLFDEQSSGELQEMLAIYKKIAPYELAQSKAESTVRKAVSSFDKSLKTETMEFFDKVRDLSLGSAPTDILSILASAGMIGYGLCEAEDADERSTVMLTAGIPIIGTIGTTVLCTTKLITGSVSLALGTAIGAVLKFVGDGLDKHRHLTAQKNHTNSEVT